MDANGFEGALVALLQQLGYDGREPLHEDLFAGLFGLPSVRVQAFLDWLIASVQPRMAVRHRLAGEHEYALYKSLVAGDHGGLLDGNALDRAEMAVQADRLKVCRWEVLLQSLDPLLITVLHGLACRERTSLWTIFWLGTPHWRRTFERWSKSCRWHMTRTTSWPSWCSSKRSKSTARPLPKTPRHQVLPQCFNR